MSRRQPPPIKEPHKLVAEMTAEERREYALARRRQGRAELRELERPSGNGHCARAASGRALWPRSRSSPPTW